MRRLTKIDVSRQFSRPAARVCAQMAFGIACAVAMIVIHIIIDESLPEASPFALVFPAVTVATLYGHWRAGVTALVITFFYAWYFVLPVPHSFAFEDSSGPARVGLSAGSAVIVLVFAETFRHFVLSAMDERDEEIARRVMLMQELEHRTKNNFALVASLLEIQRRDADDERVRRALELAASRVHSFARAYAHLGEGRGEGGTVAMKPYLGDIVARFGESALRDGIEVVPDIADMRLPRETAVAIALFVNEALTNCVKYAFPDARSGQVEVSFVGDEEEWELLVADDGIGKPAAQDGAATTGLGNRLMCAFAERAKASFEIDISDSGRRVKLVSRNGRPSTPWRVALRSVLPAAASTTRPRPRQRLTPRVGHAHAA